MKTIFTLLVLLMSAAPAFAEDEEACTAIFTFLDGREHWARIECDSPYAGKCLKEIVLKDGKHDWQEVSCQ